MAPLSAQVRRLSCLVMDTASTLQGSAKRYALGCVNSCPAARGNQEAGFTQPRDHSLAQACTYTHAHTAAFGSGDLLPRSPRSFLRGREAFPFETEYSRRGNGNISGASCIQGYAPSSTLLLEVGKLPSITVLPQEVWAPLARIRKEGPSRSFIVTTLQICRKIRGLGCVTHAPVHAGFTQPSPHIFLHFCTAMHSSA